MLLWQCYLGQCHLGQTKVLKHGSEEYVTEANFFEAKINENHNSNYNYNHTHNNSKNYTIIKIIMKNYNYNNDYDDNSGRREGRERTFREALKVRPRGERGRGRT